MLLVSILQFLRAERSYDLIIEDVLVSTYNKEYFTEPDLYIDDSNALIVNISIIKQFPIGTEDRLKIMAASMGEYVIDIGIDVKMDFCDSLEEPIVMGPLFKALGFDADNCPPGVGVYGSVGYQIPMEQLPDGFMPNNYKVILDIFYEAQNLITLHLFSKVT
ncbi:hypothetical protein KQX54_001870 [Cotesia glomerata]|uniref:Uncharacterized protein n=2 Tax=Cotesia glomerata TaxID=32391 RepID=A0AAV7HZR2_COTGL|nr:hypothetical protein KQX54_001870 [Cotesia glomerata]